MSHDKLVFDKPIDTVVAKYKISNGVSITFESYRTVYGPTVRELAKEGDWSDRSQLYDSLHSIMMKHAEFLPVKK